MYGRVYHILTAVHPDTVERISRVLEGHDLRIVQSVETAKKALDRGGVDLIFVGARFDESRMFEFLGFLREHVEHRKIPIAAAVVVPTTMNAATLEGFAHTAKILGATLFVNLNDFPDEPDANSRIRLIIETLVAPQEAVAKAAQIFGINDKRE